MNLYPCKDCTERTLACHGKCEKYAEAKAKREGNRAECRQIAADINGMNLASMRRNRYKYQDRKW